MQERSTSAEELGREATRRARSDWRRKPRLRRHALHALVEKHKSQGKSEREAIEAAGRDLGWLAKSVVHEDKRHLTEETRDLAKHYQWIVDEE